MIWWNNVGIDVVSPSSLSWKCQKGWFSIIAQHTQRPPFSFNDLLVYHWSIPKYKNIDLCK